MTDGPAYTAAALARRVPLPHARVVLDVAQDMLRTALAEQPRDRAWRDGPLDSPQVIVAADNVEVWRGVIALHERAARVAEVTP